MIKIRGASRVHPPQQIGHRITINVVGERLDLLEGNCCIIYSFERKYKALPPTFNVPIFASAHPIHQLLDILQIREQELCNWQKRKQLNTQSALGPANHSLLSHLFTHKISTTRFSLMNSASLSLFFDRTYHSTFANLISNTAKVNPMLINKSVQRIKPVTSQQQRCF